MSVDGDRCGYNHGIATRAMRTIRCVLGTIDRFGRIVEVGST